MSKVVAWVLVFLLVGIADVFWTRYFLAVERGRRLSAGAWSAAIMLVGSITTIEYVVDRWLVIPAVCGAFLGTYIATERKPKGSP